MKIDGYDLKPCPFCGSENVWIDRKNWEPYLVLVCGNENCSANGPWDLGQSGAVERWNERHEVTP